MKGFWCSAYWCMVSGLVAFVGFRFPAMSELCDRGREAQCYQLEVSIYASVLVAVVLGALKIIHAWYTKSKK